MHEQKFHLYQLVRLHASLPTKCYGLRSNIKDVTTSCEGVMCVCYYQPAELQIMAATD